MSEHVGTEYTKYWYRLRNYVHASGLVMHDVSASATRCQYIGAWNGEITFSKKHGLLSPHNKNATNILYYSLY